jgi:hypothetical protein
VATDPVPDPIDEEIRRLLDDADLRASLQDFEVRGDRGELDPEGSDDEARRIVGLPPRNAELGISSDE